MPSVLCVDQLTVRPVVSISSDGVPIIKRPRGVQVAQGQAATIRYTMLSQNGDPVDLSVCLLAGGSVKARLHETLLCSPPDFVQVDCTIVNNTDSNPGFDGCVDLELPPEVVAFSGISKIEFALLDVDGNVIFTNNIYLIVNRGQWGAPGSLTNMAGPPSVAEIKLHLRDSDPADNLWLGIEEFDLAEIAACIERPILYWNESQPPINVAYTTATFPYRYYWLEGIIACLYKLAAKHYTRVHLPYQQQGGLMIDDKNKAKEYQAIAESSWNEFKDWVLRKKVEINAWGAVQGVGSAYFGIQWSNPGKS